MKHAILALLLLSTMAGAQTPAKPQFVQASPHSFIFMPERPLNAKDFWDCPSGYTLESQAQLEANQRMFELVIREFNKQTARIEQLERQLKATQAKGKEPRP